jgi:uncharacterized protein (DUF58 family)
LIRLQYQAAKSLSFLPRQPVHSLLSGRHTSRMRGRGLSFEELRSYLPGDDVRTIDWKVTARTGKPHVRVYTEERDRPALLVVDQRQSMFYGSRRNLKSVSAAELAAVAAWRILDAGDRVGAIVFDDQDMVETRPHRSRNTVLQILHSIVAMNRALGPSADNRNENAAMLNRVLDAVARLVRHDYLVIIVSDFDGSDETSTELVTRVSAHNDVIAVPVFDPTATELPAGARLVVSDGDLQVELDTGDSGLRRILDFTDDRLSRVLRWRESLGVPVLPVSTAEVPLEALQRLLGLAAARR